MASWGLSNSAKDRVSRESKRSGKHRDDQACDCGAELSVLQGFAGDADRMKVNLGVGLVLSDSNPEFVFENFDTHAFPGLAGTKLHGNPWSEWAVTVVNRVNLKCERIGAGFQ